MGKGTTQQWERGLHKHHRKRYKANIMGKGTIQTSLEKRQCNYHRKRDCNYHRKRDNANNTGKETVQLS